MKKIITCILLLMAINASAQTDLADTTGKPAVTGFGKDDGLKTEIKIGKGGGSISSADGVVTLIFPEDALSWQRVQNGTIRNYFQQTSNHCF
jgi:hypothetical protein